jgi:hypothetical protein
MTYDYGSTCYTSGAEWNIYYSSSGSDSGDYTQLLEHSLVGKEEYFSTEVKQKAKQFLLRIIGEEAFNILEEGRVYEFDASNKMTYGMDAKGRILKRKSSRLFLTKATYGHLRSNNLPIEDCLATFYVWATTDPRKLEKNWGCGTITIDDVTKERIIKWY